MRTLRSALFVALLSVPAAAAVSGCVSDDKQPVLELPDAAGPTITVEAGKLDFDPAGIDFGYVGCGTAPATKSYRLKNIGGQPVSYALTIEGAGFAIAGAPTGSLAPSAETTITLTATIESNATPRAVREGALVVSEPSNTLPGVRVPLRVIPDGARIAVTPAVVGFGQVKVGGVGTPVTVSVKNDGFVPVNVGFTVPSTDGFGLSWTNVPAPIALGPSEEKTLNALFAPTKQGKVSFASAITIDGPVCGDAPKTLELDGEGVLLPVTVGPSPIDFGTVDCGTAAAAKTVTIQNDNSFAVTFTAALAATQPSFTISPASGTVAANSSGTITITPKPMTAPRSIAANAYGDTLTITTNAPSDVPHQIDLLQSARGAILSAAVSGTGAFGVQTVGTTTGKTVTITNTGNQAATIKLQTAAPFSASPVPPSGIVVGTGASNTGTGSVSYSPTTNATSNGQLSFSVTGPQCGATPAAIPLSGTGAYPVFSMSSLGTFNVTCGSAPAPQTLTISNGAAAQGKLIISNIQTTGVFSVTPTSLAAIAPGGSANLTVTTQAPKIGTDKALQTDTGTLTFKTNEAGFPTKTITLVRTIHGANIEYDQMVNNALTPISQIDFNGCPGVTPVNTFFYLRNTGDQDVTTVTGQTYAQWVFRGITGAPSGGIIAGGNTQVMGTYSGPITQSLPGVSMVGWASTDSNVCINAPSAVMKYNLLSANDSRCVIP